MIAPGSIPALKDETSSDHIRRIYHFPEQAMYCVCDPNLVNVTIYVMVPRHIRYIIKHTRYHHVLSSFSQSRRFFNRFQPVI